MDEPGSDPERLRSEVERLSRQVADLESRLRAIETRTAPAPVPSAAGSRAQLGLTAVNRIGAVTLAIGIIFFFKYAVDNRWIGANARVGLGLAAGLLLIGAGDRLRNRNQDVFAQGLAGCGLATLYITFYAAFAWYRLIAEPIAAAALIAVSLLAVALSLRYSHPAIAGLGFTGGLLTPILLSGDHVAAGVAAPYLAVLDCTCLLIAYKRRWPLLAPVIGAETIVTAFTLSRLAVPDWFPILAIVLGLLHLAAAVRLRDARPTHDALLATGHAFLVAGLLREIVIQTGHFVPPVSRGAAESEAGSIFLAVYGIAALAWGIMRQTTLARTLGLALIGIVIAKLYLWDVWFLDRLYRMSAFGALGILLLAASWIYSRAKDAH